MPTHAPSPNLASTAQVALDVLDSLLEGCQVVGFDFRYRFVNEAVVVQGRQSREALLGRTMMECYPGIETTEMFAQLRRCMRDRTYHRMENEFVHADGSHGFFQLRFVPVSEGVCVLSLDITEEKQAAQRLRRTEEQLHHAQKMDAIGRLAGGVAHDFNNLLSIILSYGKSALAELAPHEPIRDDLEEITKAGERAAALTRQLLAFSRQQVIEPKVLDLNVVLERMDRMLQRILGADIDLVSIFAKSLGRVRADPSSVEQIIVNLVVNARDAMPTGGKLTMETGNVELDESYAREHFGVTPGPHVMFAITDSGTGIEAATLERIFEPFFTTKPMGKGTGLGLSTVFGIVQQSGGNVWVYSEPGKGTTFKVYFPRVEAEVDLLLEAKAPPKLHGTETILLVEDDQQVRAVAATILRKYGYHVIAAANAGEALLHAEKNEGRIHLLLSDVVMPQLSGPALAKRLSHARPEMKVLCMSGYTDDSIVRHGVVEARIAFLQKPFTPVALVTKVREVLDSGV